MIQREPLHLGLGKCVFQRSIWIRVLVYEIFPSPIPLIGETSMTFSCNWHSKIVDVKFPWIKNFR